MFHYNIVVYMTSSYFVVYGAHCIIYHLHTNLYKSELVHEFSQQKFLKNITNLINKLSACQPLQFTTLLYQLDSNYFYRKNACQNENLIEWNLKYVMQMFKNFPKRSRVHREITAVKHNHKITCTLANNSVWSVDRSISISGLWFYIH